MNTHDFDREVNAAAGDLLGMLSPDEADRLRADLHALGLEGWLEWEFDHRAETTAFLTATPAQRTAHNAWRMEPMRSRLVLSAFLQVRVARVMRFEAANLIADDSGKGGVARVIHAAFRVSHIVHVAIWPFPGEAPFPEWTAEREALANQDVLAYGHSLPDGSVRSYLRSPFGDIQMGGDPKP